MFDTMTLTKVVGGLCGALGCGLQECERHQPFSKLMF